MPIPPRGRLMRHRQTRGRKNNVAASPGGGVATYFSIVCCVVLLAGSNSTSGTCVGAGTAVEAGIGINRIDVTFLDSVGGTYRLASAACYAAVRNYISHSSVKILSEVVINNVNVNSMAKVLFLFELIALFEEFCCSPSVFLLFLHLFQPYFDKNQDVCQQNQNTFFCFCGRLSLILYL